MKLINKIFICCFMMTIGTVDGAYCALPDCLKDIGTNQGLFLDPLKKLVGNDKLNQTLVDNNSATYWKWVSDFVKYSCTTNYDHIPDTPGTLAEKITEYAKHGKSTTEINNNFKTIANMDSILIPFELDGQQYDITIDTKKLFDYIGFSTAILVTTYTTKGPGDKIKKSDIPRGKHFFDSSCSPHNPLANIPDDAPVNVAGQAAFGKENEYFLDQPVELNYRSFPGLVIKDIPPAAIAWFSSEQVLAFNNYKTGYDAMKKFADNLHGTTCRGLAVYLVYWPRSYPPEIGENRGPFDLFIPPDLEDDIDEFEILSDPEVIH